MSASAYFFGLFYSKFSLETAITRNTRVKELCEEILEVQKSSAGDLGKNGGGGKSGEPQGNFRTRKNRTQLAPARRW